MTNTTAKQKQPKSKKRLALTTKVKLQIAAAVILLGLLVLWMNPTVKREVGTLRVLHSAVPTQIDTRGAKAMVTDKLLALVAVSPESFEQAQSQLFHQLALDGILPTNSPFHHYPVNDWLALLNKKGAKVKSILLGVYRNQGGDDDYALMMDGDIDMTAINDYLTRHYDTTPSANGMQVVQRDNETCVPVRSWQVESTPHHLFIASKGVAHSIRDRYRKSQPSAIPLSDWYAFSKKQLFSSMLVVPTMLKQSIDWMGLNKLAVRTKKTLAKVKLVYMGLTLTPLPSSLKLTTQFVAKDASHPVTAGQFASLLAYAKKQFAGQYSAIQWLIDNSTTSSEQNRLVLHTRITPALTLAIQRIPLETLAVMTHSASFLHAYQFFDRFAKKERLASVHPAYLDILSDVKIPEYDKEDNTVQATAGPFGIKVAANEFHPDTGKTLTLSVTGKGIVNHYGGSRAALVEVDSLVDSNGSSLLKTPRCGKTIPYRAFLTGQSTQLAGQLVLPLRTDASFTDADKLTGKVLLRLPTKVTETVIPPKAGQTSNVNHADFEILHATGNTISYRLTGNKSRFLFLQGLNKTGEVLKTISDQKTPYALGYGQTGLIAFAGKLARIKLFTADDFIQSAYPFTLHRITPSVPTDMTTQNVVKYYKYTASQFVKKYKTPPTVDLDPRINLGMQAAGPFLLSLRDITQYGTTGLTFNLYSPKAYNLEKNETAVKLTVTSLVMADGESYSSGKGKPLMQQSAEMEENHDNALHALIVGDIKIKNKENNAVNDPVSGQIDNQTQSPMADNETADQLNHGGIIQIKGAIQIAMPHTFKLKTITRPQVGKAYSFAGNQGTLMITKASPGEVTFTGQGTMTEKIIAIKPLTKDNKVLITAHVTHTMSPWVTTLHVQGNPVKYVILYTDKFTTHRYPYSLRINPLMSDSE